MLFGGRVRHFLHFWRTITSDQYILSLVQGISIPFLHGKPPKQKFIPKQLAMSKEEMSFVDDELRKLLENGCIKKLPSQLPNGWVSNIFLVPKKQGGFRMILNLKHLNKYVTYTKFKMDHIDKVIQLIRPGDFFSSLDLVSAYQHFWIKEEYQPYFQFCWRDNYYCYVTMPQGFSDSPRMFVKCTAPIMAVLHQALIDIVIYIDDTFLRAPTAELLVHNLDITRQLFTNCGLTINEEKSCTIPTQIMDFLGFTLNSVDYTIAVTKEKRFALRKLICPITSHPNKKISL